MRSAQLARASKRGGGVRVESTSGDEKLAQAGHFPRSTVQHRSLCRILKGIGAAGLKGSGRLARLETYGPPYIDTRVIE